MQTSDTLILGLDTLKPAAPQQTVKRLNVGCGRNIRQGWVNIDGAALPGVDYIVDLNDCRKTRLPFADATFDEFLISHVLEHIPDVLPLMQELYRIAKPNAKIVARVPYGSSDDAWEDPTHIRAYFLQSWGYFGQPYYWRASYGYTADWKAEKIALVIQQSVIDSFGGSVAKLNERVRHERNIVQEMVCELRKIDPPRPADRSLVAVPPIGIEAITS